MTTDGAHALFEIVSICYIFCITSVYFFFRSEQIDNVKILQCSDM